jgi:hypothetical protein
VFLRITFYNIWYLNIFYGRHDDFGILIFSIISEKLNNENEKWRLYLENIFNTMWNVSLLSEIKNKSETRKGGVINGRNTRHMIDLLSAHV